MHKDLELEKVLTNLKVKKVCLKKTVNMTINELLFIYVFVVLLKL